MSNIHLCLVNLYLMIKGVVVAAAVNGVGVCVQGPQIESRTTQNQSRHAMHWLPAHGNRAYLTLFYLSMGCLLSLVKSQAIHIRIKST
jgi:hypothetical protein